GDLVYKDNTVDKWVDNIDQYLGADFPVLAVVGNHEDEDWPELQRHLTSRIDRITDLNCEGIYGVKALCNFRGLTIVQASPGLYGVPGVPDGGDYEDFIEQQLSQSASSWKICSWHKNQTKMQLGVKSNSVGWGIYEACLNQGALVATGHEHSYSRTHLMSNFQDQTVVHTDDHLEIDRGQSFAFVSGLGGVGIREQVIDGPWWAAKYTRTQDASYGALFCTFGNVRASCYFKDIQGAMPDRFTLESKLVLTEPEVEVEPEVEIQVEAQAEVEAQVENESSSSSKRLGALNILTNALLLIFIVISVCLRNRSERRK
ncbi:MAG: metallophosphoesterase, partial [Granulosicoccus sp.]